MLGKLSIALLLVASPVFANDPATAGSAAGDAPQQEYSIKKVCQTVEVAGSFIPRRSCVNKKVPIKKPDTKSEADAGRQSGTTTEDSKGQ